MPTKLQKPLSRNPVSANLPYAVIEEQEADGAGGSADVTTIFLTASECPIGCHMCDLWQNTLPHATPPGAIGTQIATALLQRSGTAKPGWIKLYNSGNFFDPRSIPERDYAEIAAHCQPFLRVIVENHPRFGADRLKRFRDSIDAPLEVAVGLETVQPRWLGRLGKQMSRGDFDRYAAWLRRQRVDLRAFIIVGVPGISAGEAIRWARLSVRHACQSGARHISLIPARRGHGWRGLAAELPELTLADLVQLQLQALDDVNKAAVVTVDAWNLDSQATSTQDRQFVSAIKQTNLSQLPA
jgi:radical SAM enzyme (TIGR01210 family)